MSLPNYFVSSLNQTLSVGGNDTSIQLSTIYTQDGQVVTTADFAQYGRGIITVNPLTVASCEFISFTGITANTAPLGTLTGCLRGLSFKDNTQIAANQKFNVVGTPVIISFGTHNLLDIPTLAANQTFTGLITFTQPPIGINPGGSPNASSTVAGITKLSVDPISPTSPIALGANDPVVPTTGEAQALVGTVGTPSSSNKYVTNADTGTSGNSVVLRLNSSGQLPTLDGSLLTGVSVSSSFSASESITAGNAVSTYFYQSDGGIKYDTSAISAYSSVSSKAISLTVGANTNKVLVAFVKWNTNGSNPVTSMTWGGQTFTALDSIQNSSTSSLTSYILFNPTAGANSVTANFSGSGSGDFAVYSYYNVAQAVDSHSAASYTSGGSATVTPTQVADGVLYVSALNKQGGSGTPTATNIANNQLTESTNGTISGDSGEIFPKGGFVLTGISNADFALTVGLAPITAPTFPGVRKSSSATASNIAADNKYTNFIGFALSSVGAGSLVNVQTAGIVSGLSGLAIGSTYYLNDTNGTIGTSPGTNSRKVGIAQNTTTLLITNIW